MSFDKPGKNTGTRRKSRECALQMLFSVDVIGTEEFSATRYWAELGFDEVYPGAGTLALEVKDEIEKLASITDTVKSWLKKADPLEKTNKRSDWLRGMIVSTEALRRAFLDYIADLEAERPPANDLLGERLRRADHEFKSLITGLESRIVNSSLPILLEDKTQFGEFRIHGTQILAKLSDEGIPAFSKIASASAAARPFADRLVAGTLKNLPVIDERIRTRAEHWRIERMAIVDRNVLRLAVYEFLFEDTPHTVVINEALEIARRYSTFEATQFINGILDGIKLDLEKDSGTAESKKKSQSSSN